MIGNFFAQIRGGVYNKYVAGLFVTGIGYLNQKYGWHISLQSDEAVAIVSFVLANIMMLVPNKSA